MTDPQPDHSTPDPQLWLLELLRVFALHTDGSGYDDDTDELHWSTSPDGTLHAAVDCSDLFDWGSADCEPVGGPEDVAALRACRDEVVALCATFPGRGPGVQPTLPDGSHDDRWLDRLNWADLWCARKRGMRPQGAYFTRRLHSDEVRALFEAAGPPRDGGVLGDPDRWPRSQTATADTP